MTAKIVIVSILLFIMLYLLVRILVFLKVQNDINLIFCIHIKYVDAAYEGKITHSQCNQILDYLEYENLQKPYWEILLSPLIWSQKSRFKKGMYDVLMGHYDNLQSL
jgi:hypothetical protein